MNMQNPTVNPSKHPVDVPLVKRLLIRLMTRNQANRATAMLDRIAIEKNLESLNFAPEAHLGATMEIMDKAIQAGQMPGFEAGLMFGVCMTLSARSVNGKMMLKKMLADIESQQENQDEEVAEASLLTETAFPDPEVTA